MVLVQYLIIFFNKMFKFVTVLLLLPGLAFTYPPDFLLFRDNGHYHVPKIFESYLRKSDRSNIETVCPNIWDKYVDAMKQAIICEAKMDLKNTTVFMQKRFLFNTCGSSVTELFKNCLPEESKSIPGILLHTINNVFDFLSNLEGEVGFEMRNECLVTKDSNYIKCEKAFDEQINIFGFEAFSHSASDLYEGVRTFSACLRKHIKEVCKHPNTIEFVLRGVDAIFKGVI